MNVLERLLRGADRLQQKHPAMSFPLAVIMKFGDDQAGYYAALITYYAFVSLFPLLLVGFTVLRTLAGHDQALQERLIRATVDFFPVIGSELQQNIHTYHGYGIGVVLGLLVVFYGARGIANVLQDASNFMWRVPRTARPGFPFNVLRSFGIIVVGGAGLVVTTLVAGFVTSVSRSNLVGRMGLAVLALVLNSLVFMVVARLATAKQVPFKHLVLGATLGAFFSQLLQMAGGWIILHQLKGTSTLYGIFAGVLVLLFWLYLQAQVYVYAIQIAVVRWQGLWPRNFMQPPLGRADKQVYSGYALMEQRTRETTVDVHFADKS